MRKLVHMIFRISQVILFFVLFQFGTNALAQDFSGLWKTSLGKSNNTCDIYYRLSMSNDTMRVKVTFPLFGVQQYFDMPMGNATINGNKITMPMFEGSLESPDKISGTIDAFGEKGAAVLVKVNSLPPVDDDFSPVKDIKPVWVFKTKGEVWSSPSQSGENIIIGSDDGKLYCISQKDRVKKWDFNTGGLIRCNPVVLENNVFFVSDDGNLRSINANTGKVNWKYSIHKPGAKRFLPKMEGYSEWDYMQATPFIAGGKVFAGSPDSCLYVLDQNTGKLLWKYKSEGSIRANPVVAENQVFIGGWDSKVYAINLANGELQWKAQTNGQVQSAPFVYNNQVIVGSRSAKIFSFDKNSGKAGWNINFWGSWVESTPVISGNTMIVGSSDLRKVTAFNPENANIVWQARVSGYPWAIPALSQNNVFIGTVKNTYENDKKGYLYCLDATTGKVISRISSAVTDKKELNGFYSTPMVNDKYVIIGSLDGNVYCYNKADLIN